MALPPLISLLCDPLVNFLATKPPGTPHLECRDIPGSRQAVNSALAHLEGGRLAHDPRPEAQRASVRCGRVGADGTGRDDGLSGLWTAYRNPLTGFARLTRDRRHGKHRTAGYRRPAGRCQADGNDRVVRRGCLGIDQPVAAAITASKLVPATVDDILAEAHRILTEREDFAADLRQVWRNAEEVCAEDAKMVIRFGGITDRRADPLDLIKSSLSNSGWRIATIREAGSATEGKRQANAFLRTKSKPMVEYDVWATRQ